MEIELMLLFPNKRLSVIETEMQNKADVSFFQKT